ncbi:MAG TPA: divalent-cation tolerance protein CutA [Candidatus Nitrosotenuis sp.]|jgi:periplasmic divalent cation tolerance protein|nr:divalent-cation tolerance protein CutA [Candidatus Nitrosotenuis sp.]
MRIVFSTCRPEDAEHIAHTLVSEKLAASVNIVPGVRTVLRWKGEVSRQDEVLLVMRTRDDLVFQLERRYLELNRWRYPEVAAVELAEWNTEYEAWVRQSTGPEKG